jgi:hypothetical protein
MPAMLGKGTVKVTDLLSNQGRAYQLNRKGDIP